MFSKPLVFGVLALGCVTAAAGGAYVATRHNAADVQTTTPAAIAPALLSTASATPADQGVPETEAAVTPAPVDSPHQDAPEHPPAKPEAKPAASSPASSPKRAQSIAKAPPKRTVPLEQRAAIASPPSLPLPEPGPPPVSILPSAAPEPTSSETADAPRPDRFEELVLPAASVIGLQLETGLTSERARIEDRVEARVTRDVVVDGRLAVPAGARVLGSVTQVDRGGKMKDRARLSIRFHTLVLGNGEEVSLRTEPITREGEAPAADSSKKIGGAAVGGAILGAILGGGKGAMIGSMAGAGGGTAMVMAGDRNPATFQPGAIVTARLASPVTIQVHRQQ
jgi:type IV secretory pathway VirB10-like protein